MLTNLQRAWARHYHIIFVLLLVIGAFIWGVNLGRRLERSAVADEYIRIVPTTLPIETALDPPAADSTPSPNARLRVRVDIRDEISGQPVRADVWLTTIRGDASDEQLVRSNTSLVEIELPPPDEADEVFIKVFAPGYFVWLIGIRHHVEYQRVLPLPVELQRIDGTSGQG